MGHFGESSTGGVRRAAISWDIEAFFGTPGPCKKVRQIGRRLALLLGCNVLLIRLFYLSNGIDGSAACCSYALGHG
jgi:hypothetical protein